MKYFVKTPPIIKLVSPNLFWKIPSDQKEVFLTFDDGPHPEVTPWVLEQLKKHEAKATFFCVGKNVLKNRDLFKQVNDEGHVTGNHTFNHLNGWKTANRRYFKDIEECANLVSSNLFRPPYGRLLPTQAARIRKKGYKIIMWDVLSGDFDQKLPEKKCLANTLKNVEPGSIIVFHDSRKAEKKLKFVLPKLLEKLSDEGYKFRSLNFTTNDTD